MGGLSYGGSFLWYFVEFFFKKLRPVANPGPRRVRAHVVHTPNTSNVVLGNRAVTCRVRLQVFGIFLRKNFTTRQPVKTGRSPGKNPSHRSGDVITSAHCSRVNQGHAVRPGFGARVIYIEFVLKRLCVLGKLSSVPSARENGKVTGHELV